MSDSEPAPAYKGLHTNLIAICMTCTSGFELKNVPANDYLESFTDVEMDSCVVMYTMCAKCRIDNMVVTTSATQPSCRTLSEIWQMTLPLHTMVSLGGKTVAGWLGYDDVIWDHVGFMHVRKIMSMMGDDTVIQGFIVAWDIGKIVTVTRTGVLPAGVI